MDAAEKQISLLNKKIPKKIKLFQNLKKNENFKKKQFENSNIENNNINSEIIGLFTYKNLDEDINIENNMLKEKIKKRKNSIIELSSKLEKELLIKVKNLKIIQNYWKLTKKE